ncbi:alanine racemase, N-terminal domain protein, partial [Vibrio parahaemolyticus V-223/04]
RLSVS